MKRIIRRTMAGFLPVFIFLAGAGMGAPVQVQASIIEPTASQMTMTQPSDQPLSALAIEGRRFWGLDRYQTAKAIAEFYANGKVDHVVLASGENFPDALAASVLATKLGAPMLLVNPTAETTIEAFDYIKEHLSPSGNVYLIGGTGVIGGDFRERLKQLGYGESQVVQIGGIDRYETAALITQRLGVPKGTPVFLVTGEDFPDALTVASFASYNGWPILLTEKDSLPDSINTVLKNLAPKTVYLIGDSSVVSASVEADVKAVAQGSEVKRLNGGERYKTEAAVLKQFAPNPSEVYVASGSVFADALSGSILAAKTGAPIILVDPTLTDPPAAVTEYLRGLAQPRVNVFGGPGAVSDTLSGNLQGVVDQVNAEAPVLGVKYIEGTGSFNDYQRNSWDQQNGKQRDVSSAP